VESQKPKEVMKKICLLGDPAVGKTSLIRKFVYDRFDDKYITSIGTKVSTKDMYLKNAWPDGRDVHMVLLIWDILGQREHATLHAVFYRGAEGALIVGDTTRMDTMRSLDHWAGNFRAVVGSAPVVFLGNKSDLPIAEDFDDGVVASLKEKYSTEFIFTSAKTGENVERAFSMIAEKLLASMLL